MVPSRCVAKLELNIGRFGKEKFIYHDADFRREVEKFQRHFVGVFGDSVCEWLDMWSLACAELEMGREP